MAITCPFCDSKVPLIEYNNYSTYNFFLGSSFPNSKNIFELCVVECLECEKQIFLATGTKGDVEGSTIFLYPRSNAKQYPEYIPIAIRNDYDEATLIQDLSPKASATLSRRCIQGMIRDRWGVNKHNLSQEIDALPDSVSAATKNALHSVRKIGNIGAHMETDINLIVDVDPREAEAMLKLVELLIKEWYIERHETELLLAEIEGISVSKYDQRVQTRD